MCVYNYVYGMLLWDNKKGVNYARNNFIINNSKSVEGTELLKGHVLKCVSKLLLGS